MSEQEGKSSNEEQEESLKQLTPEDSAKMVPPCWKPSEGMDYNPLKSYPRNNPCPCKSGKKFKHCHLDLIPPVIPENLVEVYKVAIAQPDFIIVTKENEEMIKEQAADALKEMEERDIKLKPKKPELKIVKDEDAKTEVCDQGHE